MIEFAELWLKVDILQHYYCLTFCAKMLLLTILLKWDETMEYVKILDLQRIYKLVVDEDRLSTVTKTHPVGTA